MACINSDYYRQAGRGGIGAVMLSLIHIFIDIKVMDVDTKTLQYQVPGGMLSNLHMQMKEQNMEDRFDEVLREIPRAVSYTHLCRRSSAYFLSMR